MFGFEWKAPWELPPGMWRCWVCYDCRIVSYHHVSYCPTCGRKFAYVRARSSELARRFPTVHHHGDWRPYEWDCTGKVEQPWCVAGYQPAPLIRESREQQEHDTHAVSATVP